MKKTLIATAAALTVSSAAFAETAMEMAIAGNYCNDARPVSAEFLPEPDGRLKVTCPAGTLTGTQLLGASGLAGGQGLGLVLVGVGLAAAVASGDGSSGTTTTTN